MQSEAQAWKEAMRPLNYEVMFDVEDYHWWFVGRRAIVFTQIEDALGAHASSRAELPQKGPLSEAQHARTRALPGTALAEPRVLDIGCGTGATMDHLKQYGQPHGIDLSELPLSFSRKRGHQRVMRASATELPFESESFDLVTALDIVEHLDDDVKGLAEIRRVLKPGAPAVILVPAFQSLWGPNDDQSGHKRRYRLKELRAAVEKVGLRVERISYANFAMFIPIWLGRKILTMLGRAEQAENRINHPLINNLLAKIFSSEAGWLRRHSLPFGVSIICVARKAEQYSER
jgi:SAM-dependent methyltransferase